MDERLSASIRARVEGGEQFGPGTWIDEVEELEDALLLLVEDVTSFGVSAGEIEPPFIWETIETAISLLKRYNIEVVDRRDSSEKSYVYQKGRWGNDDTG